MTLSMTIVTCIEAGDLETEVVALLASARRWGGRLANSPMIAVTPRIGPPLRASTRAELKCMGVKHIVEVTPNPYAWNGFMNKPLTLRIAAPHIETTHALWLDGDVVVTKDPAELWTRPEVPFMACVEELGPISDGPSCQFNSFWDAIGDVLGTRDAWVKAPFTDRKLRAYCNSGVFRYIPRIGLEEAYEDGFRRVLDSGLIPKDDPSIFLHEQITLGQLAGARFGFHELPMEYNFHLGREYERLYPRSMFDRAVFVHYHRVMRTPEPKERALETIRAARPEIAKFLLESKVGTDPRPLFWRAAHKMVRLARSAAADRHMARTIRV